MLLASSIASNVYLSFVELSFLGVLTDKAMSRCTFSVSWFVRDSAVLSESNVPAPDRPGRVKQSKRHIFSHPGIG